MKFSRCAKPPECLRQSSRTSCLVRRELTASQAPDVRTPRCGPCRKCFVVFQPMSQVPRTKVPSAFPNSGSCFVQYAKTHAKTIELAGMNEIKISVVLAKKGIKGRSFHHQIECINSIERGKLNCCKTPQKVALFGTSFDIQSWGATCMRSNGEQGKLSLSIQYGWKHRAVWISRQNAKHAPQYPHNSVALIKIYNIKTYRT